MLYPPPLSHIFSTALIIHPLDPLTFIHLSSIYSPLLNPFFIHLLTNSLLYPPPLIHLLFNQPRLVHLFSTPCLSTCLQTPFLYPPPFIHPPTSFYPPLPNPFIIHLPPSPFIYPSLLTDPPFNRLNYQPPSPIPCLSTSLQTPFIHPPPLSTLSPSANRLRNTHINPSQTAAPQLPLVAYWTNTTGGPSDPLALKTVI